MSQDGPSAADFLNAAAEGEIADVLYNYGEERQSRRVARAIVAARPLSTTGELAQRRAQGARLIAPGAPKDPATRSFQAIRIHVNAELDELEAGLDARPRRCSTTAAGWRWSASTASRTASSSVPARCRGAVAPARATCPPRAAPARPTFARVSKAIRPSEAEIAAQPARALGHAARTRSAPPLPPAQEGGMNLTRDRVRRSAGSSSDASASR